MKKLISILTLFLVVAAMLHISVARHYCRGKHVATRISITGGLAGCGMESTDKGCIPYSHDDILTSNCCDDEVAYYSITDYYTISQPSKAETYSITAYPSKLMVTQSVQFYNPGTHVFTDVSPPASLNLTAVDLNVICILRI